MFQRIGVSGISTLLIFVVLPILEIVAVIMVGGEIGVLYTLLLLFGFTALGFWLLRQRVTALVTSGAGIATVDSTTVDSKTASEALPTKVANSGLGVLGAILLIVPGLVTGVIGLVLQVPPVRFLLSKILGSKLQTTVSPLMRQSRRFTGDVIDVDSHSPNQSRPTDGRPNTTSPRLLGEHPDAS